MQRLDPILAIQDRGGCSDFAGFDGTLSARGIPRCSLCLVKSTHCGAFLTFDLNLIKTARAAGHDSVREA
jgi:hypothetical protein